MTLPTALHCRARAARHEQRAAAYERGEIPICGVFGAFYGAALAQRIEAARYLKAAAYLERREARLRRRAA